MLRTRLHFVASFATPLLAASLMLPSAALASPYARSAAMFQAPAGESLAQPIPGQTPTRLDQAQTTPGSTVAGPQTQSQTLTIPPGSSPTAPPGGIVMQPQIQVLVQPQIQVQAQPQGNATPTSSADITTNTNSTPTVSTTSNTSTTTAPPVAVAPVQVAPPQQRYPHTRYSPPPAPPRVVTRVVSRPSMAPVGPAPALKRTPPPPRKGLMVTGWILFSVSYLITASNAADLYDRCPNMKDTGRCRDLAENMFIPVVGPFLAMEQARYATDDFSLAVSGSLQGLGLLMGVVGTVQYHRDRYRNRVLNEYGVRIGKNTSVNAGSRVGGGQLTLTARF